MAARRQGHRTEKDARPPHPLTLVGALAYMQGRDIVTSRSVTVLHLQGTHHRIRTTRDNGQSRSSGEHAKQQYYYQLHYIYIYIYKAIYLFIYVRPRRQSRQMDRGAGSVSSKMNALGGKT